MDPEHDVLAAAAAGVHLHDGLADVGTGGEGGSSWARALLRLGWDLSTKAAIAGVAAAAAPVVAPPALILSAAGVALSVPFAAYLASLAATDRLMRALLPPPPPAAARPTKQPRRAGDNEDDEWEREIPDADAAEAPPLDFDDYRSETEEFAVEEEHDGVPPLPLSLAPHVPEDDMEDGMADGEFASQESRHDHSSVADIGEQEVKALHNDDNVIQRIGETTCHDQQQSAHQELSVSDIGNETKDGRCRAMEVDESDKHILSPGTVVSEVPVPMSWDEDAMLQHGIVGDSEQKSGRDSPVSNTEDNAEVRRMLDDKDADMPAARDIDVSESSVLEDSAVHSKTEGELTVDSTNPIAEDVVDVQLKAIAIASGARPSVPPNDLVLCELQAASEGIYDENARQKVVIEDIVRDTGCTDTERVEHHDHGEGSTASMTSGQDAEDLISLENVPAISDHVTDVEIRPAVNRFHRVTGEENTRRNDGFGKKAVPENKGVKTEDGRNVDSNLSVMDRALQEVAASGSPIMEDNEVQRKREGELTVEMVLEQVTSNTDLVTGEAVDVQMDFITIDSDSRPPYLAADGLTEAAIVDDAVLDDIQASTLVEDIVRNTSDPNTQERVEHLGEEGACSSVSVVSVLTVDDGISCVQAIRDNATSVETSPDVGHSHETAGLQALMNEGFGRKVVSVDEDIYTEEQLWEELDTIRTVTGYREVASSTLESELTALYIFVGVEPLVSSRDDSDLMELSAKLQFLKSIIGME
ncbi:hypothetical protein ACP4OV_028591 [Aristida adscensionis]